MRTRLLRACCMRRRRMRPRLMRMGSARGSTRWDRRPCGTGRHLWTGDSRVMPWVCTRRGGMPWVCTRCWRVRTRLHRCWLYPRRHGCAGNSRHGRSRHLRPLGRGHRRGRARPRLDRRGDRRLPRGDGRRSRVPLAARGRRLRHGRRLRALGYRSRSGSMPRVYSCHRRRARTRCLSGMRRGTTGSSPQHRRPTRVRRMWRRGHRVPGRYRARQHGRGGGGQLRRRRGPRMRGGLDSRIHRSPGRSELGRPVRRCWRARCRLLWGTRHGSPSRGRQGGSPGPRGTGLWRTGLWRTVRSARRCTGRPPRHRSLRRGVRGGRRARRPHRRRGHRRGSLRRLILIPAQELSELGPKRLPLRAQRRGLYHGRLRRAGGLGRPIPCVIAQKLPGLEPAEHPLLLGCRGGRGARPRRSSRSPRRRGHRRPSRSPRSGARAHGLGIQLDVALRAGDAVALLQVEVEAQLRDDARNDAQAGDERQLIHRREVEGARHRHPQALALHREREGEVLAGQRRRNQRERRRRDVLELGLRRQRVARLLRQHRPQRFDGQVLQLDQVGPQSAAIDHLGLEGLVELPLVDEALADQDRTELFRHEVPDSRRLQ